MYEISHGDEAADGRCLLPIGKKMSAVRRSLAEGAWSAVYYPHHTACAQLCVVELPQPSELPAEEDSLPDSGVVPLAPSGFVYIT